MMGTPADMSGKQQPETTMLLNLCLLSIPFFVVIFCALRRKRHARAIFKGPLNSFHIEFEADDEKGDPKP